jgi:hypothetical protein
VVGLNQLLSRFFEISAAVEVKVKAADQMI